MGHFKEPAFSFIDILYWFSVFSFSYPAIISRGLDVLSFSSLLRWKLRILILDLYYFLMYAFNFVNFVLSTSFTHPTNFYVIFSFTIYSKYFLTYFETPSLNNILFRSVLLMLQLLCNFSAISLLLVYNEIILKCENLLSIVSILLYLLCPKIWYVLINILYEPKIDNLLLLAKIFYKYNTIILMLSFSSTTTYRFSSYVNYWKIES